MAVIKTVENVARKQSSLRFSIIKYLVVLLVSFLAAQGLAFDIWDRYTGLVHTIFELFCIFTSLTIFFVVWYSYEANSLGNRIIGLGFLLIGAFDILHTYYYAPLGLCPAGYGELSARFWLLARLSGAIILLVGISKVGTTGKLDKWIGFFFTASITIAVSITVIFCPGLFPALYTASYGVTGVKIIIECIIMALFAASLYKIWKGGGGGGTFTYQYVFMALMLAIPAELCFTFYTMPASFYVAFGHVLKAAYFFYFFKGVFISSVTYPYKRTKNALNQSEERFRIAFEHAAIGMAVTTTEGQWLKVNSTLCEMMGYSEGELMKIPANEIVYSEDRHINDDHLQQLLCGEKGFYHQEMRYVHKMGYALWVFANVSLVRDVRGEPMCLVLQIQDITGSKEIYNQLLESERRYRLLIEVLPYGVSVIDENEILFVNTAAAKLLGVEHPDEVMGKYATDFIHSDSHETLNNQVIREVKNGRITPLTDLRIKQKDGKVVDIETLTAPFDYFGKSVMLSIANDISERKKSEELQKQVDANVRLLKEAAELDRLKTEFFANLSHEFRTPLNVILGTLQLYELHLSGNKDMNIKSMTKYAKIMKQNCMRLLRMINNLIDTTKMDVGFFEIHPGNYNIVSVVEDISLSVADYTRNKGIELQFDTDTEECIIACDPDKIERIMLNLLSNSIKFTKAGGNILVNIFDRGDHVIISVKDTGIGIPQDKLQYIFDRFRQVDKSLTRNHEGSGIGLSLVRTLVEMHGGKISVQSEYGSGTEFLIELPAKVLPEAAGKACAAPGKVHYDYIERINIEFSDIYME